MLQIRNYGYSADLPDIDGFIFDGEPAETSER